MSSFRGSLYATNSYGTSSYSNTWNFTTASGGSAPAIPTLSSPNNGSTNQSTSPTLSWNASNGASSYTLQVSTNSSFSSYFYNHIGLTGTSQQISGLSNSTKYYWRVSATNSYGTSSYSNTWNFTTASGGSAPAIPTLSSPNNGSTNQSTSPTLSWNASNGASSYTLQVSTNTSFTSYFYNHSGLTSTSQQISGLSNNTVYYWRVSATNDYGTSSYSNTWNFSTLTGGTLPVIPTLLSPTNGATDESTSPTLSWNISSGANSYSLQVSTDNTFTSLIYNQNNLNITNQQISGLNNNTSYYWRVSATNDYGTSQWSDIWSFKTSTTVAGGTPCPGIPTVTYAGKTYHTVQIGDQCWLKENLDVGTMIDSMQDQTNNGIIEKYCYNDDPAKCATYGGLYQWAEAVQYQNGATNTDSLNQPFGGNVKGICPNGWHLPTQSELVNKLEVYADYQAKKLLEVGETSDATNETGFSALFAGNRLDYPNLGLIYFSLLGSVTHFWSSSEYSFSSAGNIILYWGESEVGAYGNEKSDGNSVRCLKDQ